MRWYIPSWNGDVRLVPFEKETTKTKMLIEKPTLAEQKQVNMIGEECAKRGWIKEPWEQFAPKEGFFSPSKWEFLINASLEQLGPVVVGILRPGPAVLTAIKLKDGQVITASEGEADLERAIETAYRTKADQMADHPKSVEPASEPPKPSEIPEKGTKKSAALAKKGNKPEAAATVKRPTCSCPSCEPGSVGPAREVLLAFLNEQEHEDWSMTRTIVVTGGLSGCRYLLAHRHTKVAQEQTRICYDLDSGCVVHFHDWTVPPEEEVLAAKLILEHREPWLRNEATMLGVSNRKMVFKNPFGDVLDGVADSNFTSAIGILMRAALTPRKGDQA